LLLHRDFVYDMLDKISCLFGFLFSVSLFLEELILFVREISLIVGAAVGNVLVTLGLIPLVLIHINFVLLDEVCHELASSLCIRHLLLVNLNVAFH